MNVENLLHPTVPFRVDGAVGCRDGRDKVNIHRVATRLAFIRSTFLSKALASGVSAPSRLIHLIIKHTI